jgi:hypothetical protein
MSEDTGAREARKGMAGVFNFVFVYKNRKNMLRFNYVWFIHDYLGIICS